MTSRADLEGGSEAKQKRRLKRVRINLKLKALETLCNCQRPVLLEYECNIEPVKF